MRLVFCVVFCSLSVSVLDAFDTTCTSKDDEESDEISATEAPFKSPGAAPKPGAPGAPGAAQATTSSEGDLYLPFLSRVPFDAFINSSNKRQV